MKPLDDITVLDVTTALAGPFATLLLAGLGARVIKVENPVGGDTSRHNAPYLGLNGPTLTRQHPDDVSISSINRLRNKLGVTLNLKHPRARQVFGDLVAKSDVLVENFSFGVLERLGVGYAFAKTINPRIVFCSITGFGTTGDGGPGKAMDTIIQAMSGVMQTSGGPDDPPVRVGFPVADLGAPLFGVIGVLAALHQAKRTGVGQHVDISMLGTVTSLLADEPFDALSRCGVPVRTGLTLPRLTPFGVYRALDGHVAICAPTDVFVAGLVRALGDPDLAADPRFQSRDQRVRHADEVNAIVERWTSTRTVRDIQDALEAVDVPCAEVRDPAAAIRDPHVTARHETVPLHHPTHGNIGDIYGMGLPIHFSDADAGFDQPPPALGQHNAAVYHELLGYSDGQLDELKRLGVI
jgi:CoA:oxalate CoA-transferase